MPDTEFDLESLEQEVVLVLGGAEGDRALDKLREQASTLQNSLNGGAVSIIKPDTYPVAESLIAQALRLAEEFARREDTPREETAQHLRCAVECSAFAKDRDRVGPAMLAWADCTHRMGESAKADQIYQAIISDYLELLDRPGASDATEIALRALLEALQKKSDGDPQLIERTKAFIESA